jgi:hypothetical protein
MTEEAIALAFEENRLDPCAIIDLTDSSMPLSQPDRNKIIDELKSFVPGEVLRQLDEAEKNRKALTRWQRFCRVLREWGMMGAALTGSISLFGIMMAAIYVAVGESSKNSEFRGRTDEHFKSVDKELISIKALLAAANVNSPANQREAQKIFAAAKTTKALPLEIAQQVGEKFLNASIDMANAWNVAQGALEYSSNMTVLPAAYSDTSKQVPKVDSLYRFIGIPQKAFPDFIGVNPPVSQEQAAKVEPISAPAPQAAKEGYAHVILRGGAAPLDQMLYRHAIFQNAEIHYSGGALSLEDVRFANCTFVITDTANSRTLARAIFANEIVTLRLNQP